MSTIEQNTKKIDIWYLTIFKDELQHPEDAIYDLSCQQKSKKGKMFYHQVLIYNKLVTFNELKKLYPSARLQKRKLISSVLKTIDYIKSESCNFKYLKEQFDFMYDDIIVSEDGSNVSLTCKNGDIIVVTLEKYIRDEIRNYASRMEYLKK